MSDHFALALRQAVRAERTRAGLSQAEVADRLGMSRQAYAAMEIGTRKMSAGELPDICRALGVPLSRLLIDVSPEDREALGLR